MEGATHCVRSLWDAHKYEEDDWGVLLIDTRNPFNEGNHEMMVRIARCECPYGSRFLFNIHSHHSVLVARGEAASKIIFFHIKEGKS